MMYELFRDFASPIATIIAASVAGGITYAFAKRQAGIAASQRDIALDKLKFDLFDARYEIYEAAKSLIEHVSFVTELEKTDTTKIRALYVKLDEARFYFPPDIRAILDEIHKLCERSSTTWENANASILTIKKSGHAWLRLFQPTKASSGRSMRLSLKFSPAQKSRIAFPSAHAL